MAHIHEKIDFVVSAYITFGEKILLAHHRELKMWLPIGGHIELHEDPEQALFREIEEECGLARNHVELIGSGRAGFSQSDRRRPLAAPLHLDIHRISPTHEHVAFNYFLRSRTDAVRLLPEEHHGIRWFSEDELEQKEYMIPPDVQWYGREAIKKSSAAASS